MLNSITINPQLDTQLIIKHESAKETPGLRWVRITESPEGGFIGEFRLNCVGIFRPRWQSGSEAAEAVKILERKEQMLRSILALLERGDAIEFVFRGGGREAFRWDIRGRTQRGTADAASRRATALLPALQALTSALEGQYRFEPQDFEDESTSPALPYHKRLNIEAAAVCVPSTRGTMGFASPIVVQELSEKHIVVPIFQAKKGLVFPSMAAAIAGSPIPLCCSVSISPFSLGADDSRLLKKAADHVAAVQAQEHHRSDPATAKHSIPNGCREALRLWANSGGGYRLIAILSASEPISTSLQGLITNDLFPNHAAVMATPTLGAAQPETSLDLSNAIAMRETLPVLFPDLDTLQRQDSAKIYNRRLPKLPADGLRMGRIDEAGSQMNIHADSAYRDRHTYIIGATGTGKSTLLLNCIRQDIMAGEGFCLIDPHGDLYEQTLLSIPASRQNDVILLNPCETEEVPGINFLEVTSEKTRAFEVNYAINELIKMLERFYDMRVCGGPMFETYFRNAFLLLMDTDLQGNTLTELAPIFEDRAFREHLKQHCTNRYAVNFWNKQAEKAGGDASLQNVAPYITSKLTLLVQSALLRPIIGQSRSTINFREVMDRRKILLVNLSKGQLGELDMQLLGKIIIGKIFSSAMNRSSLPQKQRTPFHLYVDEFQNFTTDTVASLLSEARKFGLCLTLANQNLAQLNTNVGKQNLFDAILGNVGNFVLFRVGAPDADKMQTYTRPHFNYEDLQNMPNYHALARLQTGEGPSIPFIFRTEPPAPLSKNRKVLSAIRRRQHRYRTPCEQVEKQILERQSIDA